LAVEHYQPPAMKNLMEMPGRLLVVGAQSGRLLAGARSSEMFLQPQLLRRDRAP
jgi:hypothetical protein